MTQLEVEGSALVARIGFGSLLALWLCVTVVTVVKRTRADSRNARSLATEFVPSVPQIGIGLITMLFAFSGRVGPFAAATSMFLLTGFKVAPLLLPGTIMVGLTFPVIACGLWWRDDASFWPLAMYADWTTAGAMVMIGVLGGALAAETLLRLKERRLRIALGLGLLGQAVFLTILPLTTFTGVLGPISLLPEWMVAHFVSGAAIPFGVGTTGFPNVMELFHLLGRGEISSISPPFWLCSAFLMPLVSLRFVQRGRFDARAATGLATGGLLIIVSRQWLIAHVYSQTWWSERVNVVGTVVFLYTSLRLLVPRMWIERPLEWFGRGLRSRRPRALSDSPSHVGKYMVVRRLRHGGMGTLYLGHDPQLDRPVALKVIRADIDSAALRERFEQEARAVSRLHHPNIVTIFDYGEFEGQPYFAMEYIEGESLAELIARRAPLPVARKLQLIDEVCAGMACVHRANFVHRDLKPDNIMVDGETGLVKILDFGIVRSLDTRLSRFTQGIGTPCYMSPEQVNGGRVDARSDIFAIGAVFYELLTYRRAFDGDTQIEIIHKIVSVDPLPVADLCAGLDPKVEYIVTRALSKEPAARYPDVTSLRADLAQIMAALPAVVLGTPQLAAPSTVAPPERAPWGVAPRLARVDIDDVKVVRRDEPKVGRNDPCPCGSGKKYKMCHGAAA